MKHYSFDNTAVCLNGTNAAREFLEPIFSARDRELLVVALCDNDLRVLQLLIYPGETWRVQFPLSEILKEVVRTECAGIILAHNHPSGDPHPSSTDLDLTRKVVMAGNALDFVLLDHLILDDGPWFSFRQTGLI